MAIYQFNLTAIPRIFVLDRFGRIPNSIDLEAIEQREPDIDPVDNTQNWWKAIDIDSKAIVARIDKYVSRAKWGNSEYSFNWKTDSIETDNDAYLSLNEKTGGIESLSFRADLREKGLVFLKNMILLASEKDWLLMDLKGNLSLPQMEEVKKIIEISNCHRFLTNPEKFFDDLESGVIEIE